MENLELDRQFHIPSREEDSYYHEYCRLYLANVVLTNQVKDLIDQKNQLVNRLHKLEDDECYSSYDRVNEKNKRFRRTAHEIERYYKCIVKSCEKSYGSEGSLNQHYKLKHPEIYLTLPSVQQMGQCSSHLQVLSRSEVGQESDYEPIAKYEALDGCHANENESENQIHRRRRKTTKRAQKISN